MKLFNKFSSKGFTLIELLIVIAILGVLAAGLLVAIDPIEKINQANDSKVQNDIGAIGRAGEAFATVNGGTYPTTQAQLVTAGELKRELTKPTASYGDYTISANGPCGDLLSKRYSGTPHWTYNWTNGTSGAVAACP